MCESLPADPYLAFLDELVTARLLIPSGVRGVYGRGGDFEHVVEQFERLVTREGRPEKAEVMRFPPLLNRAHYAKINHIHNFPDLMGSVDTFTGNEADHRAMIDTFQTGGDWTRSLVPAETMLVPAACYPMFPTATGTLGEAGRTVDLRTFVFRHEPSDDPARMQIFRQREYVRLGTADQALDHREAWLRRGKALLESLGLPVEAVVANDPFFGRGGRLAKATQTSLIIGGPGPAKQVAFLPIDEPVTLLRSMAVKVAALQAKAADELRDSSAGAAKLVIYNDAA